MKNPNLEKIDFAKLHKDQYSATRRVKEVSAAKACFLSLEGKGDPACEAFQKAIEKMYSLAYTIKFSLLMSGQLDFAVSKLECLWFLENPDNIPREQWPWELLIRIPEEVKTPDLKAAGKTIMERKGIDTSAVKRKMWKEGRAIQMMHIGPYEKVGDSYKLLDLYAREKGLKAVCPGHEIYISDPRRVAPEKIKTIARLPVQVQDSLPLM
jgi:hypothetical protein